MTTTVESQCVGHFGVFLYLPHLRLMTTKDLGFVAITDKPREVYVPPEPPEGEQEIFLSMQKGINFDKYAEIPVECTGNNAPREGISR